KPPASPARPPHRRSTPRAVWPRAALERRTGIGKSGVHVCTWPKSYHRENVKIRVSLALLLIGRDLPRLPRPTSDTLACTVDTGTEWRNGPYAACGQSGSSCHMPGIDQVVSTGGCTVFPAALLLWQQN